MLKDDLDHLIQIATSDPYSSDALVARKEYQKSAGEVYEDDKSYESQMALFLEWYIFDRVDPAGGRTILETIVDKGRENLAPNFLKIFDGFVSNIHSLFAVKKIREHSIKVVNLFDNEQYEVIEPVVKLLFSKNDLFEGRLLPYDNSYHFTGSFCFHPENSKKFIRREIKQLNLSQIKNKKELKIQTTKLKGENKKLNKIITKVKKIKEKILNSHSENKISAMKKQLAELESNQSIVEGNCSLLENEISTFVYEKIVHEKKIKQTQLIQKLSRMRLIWERSRHIELNDIYRN